MQLDAHHSSHGAFGDEMYLAEVWQAGDVQGLAAGTAGRLADDHATAVSWKSWKLLVLEESGCSVWKS